MPARRADASSSRSSRARISGTTRGVRQDEGVNELRASADVTLVLIHGAGNTAGVWRSVQTMLSCRSVAIDLPGRRDKVAGIADVAIEDAVESVAADVDRTARGPLILVGHSAGGILLPQLAARWADRLQALVFVAGLCAAHGEK